MAQERSIPGCPWAFADDMRGIIDKKEFRFVLQTTVVFNRAQFVNLTTHIATVFYPLFFLRYKTVIRRIREKSKKEIEIPITLDGILGVRFGVSYSLITNAYNESQIVYRASWIIMILKRFNPFP